jgi:hypothetical protein
MSEPLSLWNLTLIDQVGTTEESEPQETAVRSRQNALLLAGVERGKSGAVHRLYYSITRLRNAYLLVREAELDSHVVDDARGILLCITKGMISESGPRAFYLLSLQ